MNDIQYIEFIKSCGLYGNDHLGDMLELCYQVAAHEREKCADVADIALLGCERSIRDRVVRAIRARGEK